MKSVTFGAAVAALALAATPAAAAYIYTPGPAFDTQEGNTSSVVITHAAQRVQFSFGATTFGSEPLMLNGVSFRFDRNVTNAFGNSGAFALGAGFKVRLATLDDPFSATFDANLPDAVTVMSGARSLPFVVGARSGQTKPFGVHFIFTTPYRYDPSRGDLVLDMYFPAQTQFGNFDFVRDNPLLKRVYATGPAPITGTVSNLGPVARFDVSAAVPEPAAWALMITGFGLAGATLRGKRSASGRRAAC